MGILSDFGQLVSDCGDIIADCGKEIGGIIGETVDEFCDDPVKFTVDSVVELAPIAAGAAVGVAAVAASGGAAAPLVMGVAKAGGAIGGSIAGGLSGATAIKAASTVVPGAKFMAGGYVASEVFDHVVDNYVRDTVSPIRGCIVFCKLAGGVEHSGIYIGNGKITHLDGSGTIESVSASDFLRRLGGVNPAFTIYVSCTNGSAVGSDSIARRAANMLGRSRKYDLILDNCHQFTSGCITGDFDNADNFLWMLRNTAQKAIGATEWRVWKR